jgi:small subunit ribosomal protein S6
MPARDYEILYIVKPDLDEEAVAAATKSVDDLISGFGGTVQKTDQWGRRKLAYEVQHLREGYYVLTDFQFDPDRVPDLEGQLRISETVFRYLVTRKPDRVRSTRARRKAARAAAEAAAGAAASADAESGTDAENVTDAESGAEVPETGTEVAENEPVGVVEVE